MKKLISLSAMMLLTGCALFTWRKAEVYPMSYDQTYVTVLSALDDMDHWDLMGTDQPNGVIKIKSEGYWRGEKEVQFIVKRVDPFHTEVKLHHKCSTPFTQKFFKAMDKRVADRALTHPT